MPRTARHIVPGVLVHVRCRLVDGRFDFDDAARRAYLARLERVLRESDWILLSYALMSSHVHLGLESGEASLRSWLHALNTAVAGWISARRRAALPRTLGQVFGDRPGTDLMPLGRAFPLLAYHHNNPVDAGVVATARQSRWTSHRQYLGLETRCSALDVRRGLELCGMGASTFDRAVNQAADSPALAEGSPRAIVALVSVHFQLPKEDVMGGSKSRSAVTARRVALAIGSAWGHSCARMAMELSISRAAAAKLQRTSAGEVVALAEEISQRWRLAG